MSLEAELARNTAAIEMLTKALSAFGSLPQAQPEKVKKAPEVTDVQADPVVAEVPAAVESAEVDYAAVAKAITTVYKTDRQKVIDALIKFGAKKGPDLNKKDYAAFLAELA